MSNVFRANRKMSDSDIVRLNSVGLSLATIAAKLKCHTSTVTHRLKAMNIAPADTRRTFMEDIYLTFTPDQMAWLESQLGPHISIKDYIKNLLVREFLNSLPGDPNAR